MIFWSQYKVFARNFFVLQKLFFLFLLFNNESKGSSDLTGQEGFFYTSEQVQFLQSKIPSNYLENLQSLASQKNAKRALKNIRDLRQRTENFLKKLPENSQEILEQYKQSPTRFTTEEKKEMEGLEQEYKNLQSGFKKNSSRLKETSYFEIFSDVISNVIPGEDIYKLAFSESYSYNNGEKISDRCYRFPGMMSSYTLNDIITGTITNNQLNEMMLGEISDSDLLKEIKTGKRKMGAINTKYEIAYRQNIFNNMILELATRLGEQLLLKSSVNDNSQTGPDHKSLESWNNSPAPKKKNSSVEESKSSLEKSPPFK